jgi:hypothetical protein
MSFGKLVLYLVLGFIAIIVGVKIVGAVVGWLLGILIPIAVVAGVGYLVYSLIRPKSLNSRTRSPLP